MSRTATIDYPTWTKRSFLFGVSLLLIGLAGQFLGQAYFGPLPAWEQTLFVDLEFLGIAVALFAPIVFSVVLPLIE